TALQTGTGDILKVRGPQMGCAVVLQGRYITHQALRALGAQERITMVTSFRPRSPHLPDDTVLTSVRPVSDLSELYYEFGEYRLEIVEERLRAQLKFLRETHTAGKKINTKAFKKFLQEQEIFLRRTNEEIVENEKVQVGHVVQINIPNEKGAARPLVNASKRSLSSMEDTQEVPATKRNSMDQPATKKLKTDTAPPPENDKVLSSLKTEFDNLRALVTCKVCDRLLYEPYIIACGHTYCYSCLCTWFVNNKRKKTCPDCRKEVTEAPAPAYLIREMTHLFVKRAELLPAAETMEEHAQWQQEEADIVQQDKTNTDVKTGGLFKGLFSERKNTQLVALRDPEDGVDRCPRCHWELEDGLCLQCGLHFDDSSSASRGNSFGGFSDMDAASEQDVSGEELDAEIDIEDMDDDLFGPDAHVNDGNDLSEVDNLSLDGDNELGVRAWLHHTATGRPVPTFASVATAATRRRAAYSAARNRRRRNPSSPTNSSSSVPSDGTEIRIVRDDDGDERDSTMSGFIDDEESDQGSESDTSGPVRRVQSVGSPGQRRRARRIVESDSGSNDPHETEDDEPDEGGSVLIARRRNAHQVNSRATRALSASTDYDESYDENDGNLDGDPEGDVNEALLEDGWSPYDHSDTYGDDLRHGRAPEATVNFDEDDDEYNSDGGSALG
ncbi:hypothetical protein B0A49_11081, partial [Cryomyces minteri]